MIYIGVITLIDEASARAEHFRLISDQTTTPNRAYTKCNVITVRHKMIRVNDKGECFKKKKYCTIHIVNEDFNFAKQINYTPKIYLFIKYLTYKHAKLIEIRSTFNSINSIISSFHKIADILNEVVSMSVHRCPKLFVIKSTVKRLAIDM